MCDIYVFGHCWGILVTAILAIHACAVRMVDASRGRYMGMLWETSSDLGGDNYSCYSVSVCILFDLLVSLMHQVYIKIFCIRHQLLPEFSFHQLPENLNHRLQEKILDIQGGVKPTDGRQELNILYINYFWNSDTKLIRIAYKPINQFTYYIFLIMINWDILKLYHLCRILSFLHGNMWCGL